ncbi:hypothetical protein [Dactylosporangium darangshiense]|uniref:hypothetical protein n=1 Tax=Dactylosporangium darangshiense TaxID=579108 RepID=UPI00362BB9C5
MPEPVGDEHQQPPSAATRAAKRSPHTFSPLIGRDSPPTAAWPTGPCPSGHSCAAKTVPRPGWE